MLVAEHCVELSARSVVEDSAVSLLSQECTYIFYSPAASTTEPDSASESSYLVQIFIVRLYEKRPLWGEMHSDLFSLDLEVSY